MINDYEQKYMFKIYKRIKKNTNEKLQPNCLIIDTLLK